MDLSQSERFFRTTLLNLQKGFGDDIESMVRRDKTSIDGFANSKVMSSSDAISG